MKTTKKLALTLVLLALGAPVLQADSALDGEWNGAISIMGQEMGITTRFQGEGDSLSATLDIPMQGAKDVPMQNVSYEHPKVHFEIPGAAVAVFEGTVDGDSISGDFLQSGMKGSFELKRATAATAVTDEAAEVEAAEELPYDEAEVEFTNGDLKFAGTLTLPQSAGPHPAVVMITGSGPQNRDEEVFGFKVFRLIADYLTREGIAVLRYDDRGVGGSTGSVADSSSADFATDVVAAARFLKQRQDIDAAHIGAIGHSEGGIIAPIAAQSGELAFVVLLSGTSMTGAEVLYDQGDLILKANGATDEERATNRKTQEMMMQAIRTDEGWDEIKTILREQTLAGLEKMPAEQREGIADTDAFVTNQVEGQLAATRTPWFRAFIDYDPVPALKALEIPVLAVFGELDLQVPAKANSEGMEKAFSESGNKKYRIEILSDANHLFQKATTGSPSEYMTLEKAFVPELMPLVNSWIKENL